MRFAVIVPFLVLINIGPVALDPEYQFDIQSVDNGKSEEAHDCCLWGAISNDLPENVLYNNLVSYENSLWNLSLYDNVDGWGIGSYRNFGAQPSLFRGRFPAYLDTVYDRTVALLDTSVCRILLAHIRHCSSGCCCRGCNTITDPHPFWRLKGGKNWSFAHNGTIPKSLLRDLIGEEYLEQNPPNGSGIPECDPSDTSHVTDSELFFLLLLKGVEEAGWQPTDGIINALVELINHNNGSKLNFILSDGFGLWAFRKGNELFSLYDSLNGYSAAATYFPDSIQGNWRVVQDYVLIYMRPGESPASINLRAYLPPEVTCPGDTSLLYIESRPVCLGGFIIDDPDNNLDSITVNCGIFNKERICFNPNPGINTVVLTVYDHYGNVASCSTVVDATLSDPGYLNGLVTDSSLTPLANVSIMLSEIVDSTGSDGIYMISDIIPGAYMVKFSLPGYADTTFTNVPIIANDTTIIDVALRTGCRYRPGDSNGDGRCTGLDVVFSVSYLKGGQRPPYECNCPIWGRFYAAADANGSCTFSGLDVTYTVSYLKSMGPAPRGCPECLPPP